MNFHPKKRLDSPYTAVECPLKTPAARVNFKSLQMEINFIQFAGHFECSRVGFFVAFWTFLSLSFHLRLLSTCDADAAKRAAHQPRVGGHRQKIEFTRIALCVSRPVAANT
jgi:hypothetical protein